jgi:ketosteroid isomerase-like protein
MKERTTMRILVCTLLCAALLSPSIVHAEEDSRLSKLQSIDEGRVAAFKSGDAAALGSVLSDELRYAHSNGLVDSKASLIELISTGKTKYLGYDYEERIFTFPAPKIALMSGRAHIQAETANGKMDSVLSFLAVWREEADGKWRFLAWQSCRLPPKAP